MSRSVFLLPVLLIALSTPAFAARNDDDVDTRTDSALRGAATTVAPDRGGESLMNWADNPAPLPVRPALRQAGNQPAQTAHTAPVSHKAKAKMDSAKTRDLNLEAAAHASQPANAMPASNPIVIRDAAGEVLNPPVAQSNQYDPNNKPLIVVGNTTVPQKIDNAQIMTMPVPKAAPAPVMMEVPAAKTTAPATAHTLNLPPVPAKNTTAAPTPILRKDTIAPVAPKQPAATTTLPPLQAVNVPSTQTQPVPMIEDPQPVAAPQAAPAVQPVAATAQDDKNKPKGLTTPHIGAIPRVVIESSPIGKY